MPIMYPKKPAKVGGSALNTFWSKGQAEYLSPQYGDDLATFIDADHGRHFHTHRSVSVWCILFNGVAIAYGCKK